MPAAHRRATLAAMSTGVAMMIATAPGKLILAGEYAVLDGAPAIVVAVDRRVVARRNATPRGSSPFLVAVSEEIAARRGASDPAARAALEISVDSAAFYHRASKLGLGSSAAVTVAATALALEQGEIGSPAGMVGGTGPRGIATLNRREILTVALAAHARAQGPRGARGSGADIAASVYGGTIAFSRPAGTGPCLIEPMRWPGAVAIVPFFTGVSADTAQLVARVAAAREVQRTAVDAALGAIAEASRTACAALAAPPDVSPVALIGALALAADATDRLAAATRIDLVPACVTAARAALSRLGGTAKTTGAGGGDVAVAVVPATLDVTIVTRSLIEAGCQPLRIMLDDAGVDLRPDAS
jgi:phosphomevalonate kinase